MGLIGDWLSGNLGSNAAKSAANVQATGATNAQNLEKQNQTNALNFQNDVWSGTQANQQPYNELGGMAANKLATYLQTPFAAPTAAEVQSTPGYQFQLDQGVDALDKSAAASGNLFSGSQGVGLEEFGQGLANTTYDQAYNRALNTYMTNYNTLFQPTQLGETAATNTGQAGQAAAFNTSNLDLTGGAQQAQQINNAAAARASGYIGSANAWRGAINDANTQLSEAALMAGA